MKWGDHFVRKGDEEVDVREGDEEVDVIIGYAKNLIRVFSGALKALKALKGPKMMYKLGDELVSKRKEVET